MNAKATNAKAPSANTEARMRVLVKDKEGNLETVDKSKSVIGEDKKKVKATFTITYDNKTYVSEDSIFDFTGCSEEDILMLATASAIIKTQARAKTAMRSNVQDGTLAKNWKHIDVKKDVVDSERRPKSALEKATAALGGLSAEDKAALLKMLSEASEAE